MLTNREFVNKLKDIANNYKTLYIMGCFGAPITGGNVSRYCNNYPYNQRADRTRMIKEAANQNPPVYGFDCVCLIKGVLWGWDGDANAVYGGAEYTSNGVPDIDENTMISRCSDLSTDFSKVEVGEAVWTEGHIGVYIGDGLAVECTPLWENGVQITACNCSKDGYNRRNWKKHGKLPYVKYVAETTVTVLNVGDEVMFKGNTHYTSSYPSATGRACKSGKAVVTAKNENGSHPYHLVAVSGGTSNVYGWVNASDIEGFVAEAPAKAPAKAPANELKVGDSVRLAADATIYGTSNRFADWVYDTALYVREINGSRVVVSTVKTGAVTGAVDIKYLTEIE